MRKLLKQILCLGLFFSGHSAVALTINEVVAWSVTLSSLLGGGVYCYKVPSYSLTHLNPIVSNADNTFCRVRFKETHKTPVMVGMTTFLGSMTFFGWVLSKCLPSKRYEWAIKTLDSLEANDLFNQKISGNIDQVLEDSGCQAEPLPLVCLFKNLQHFDRLLTEMITELKNAANDEGPSPLLVKITALLHISHLHLKRIRENETEVKKQPQWLSEWKVYQQRELEKEKMLHNHFQSHIVYQV